MVSKYNQSMFTFHHNKLQGIVSTHVDDFCWAGAKHFMTQVIDPIRKKFKVKLEKKKKKVNLNTLVLI